MEKLHLIRGKRIMDQILTLTETTVTTLRNNLNKIPTKKRQHATDPVQVKNLSMTPSVPSGVLEIKALTTSDGRKYDTVVQFSDMEFQDEDNQTNVSFTASDDEQYNIEKINLNQKNVKVRCNCLDFYHRFAPHNSRDGSLYGNPPAPYKPKTDRASDNPQKLPGVCKHILKTVDGLRKSGLIR